MWEHAARVAAQAAAQIRAMAGTSPAAAADAAWAASDTLHVAAAALGSDGLRQAADAYDRAARAQYGRIPAPGPAGTELRQAARLISACAYLTRDPARTWLVLIARLAALADAVAELRQVQQRAAQAAAARTAARHLHARRPARPGPGGPMPARRPGSPRCPSPARPPRAAPGPRRADPGGPTAARGPRPGRHLPGPTAPAGNPADRPAARACGHPGWLPTVPSRSAVPGSICAGSPAGSARTRTGHRHCRDQVFLNNRLPT